MSTPFTAAPELDKESYDRIRHIVYDKSGIVLKDDKATLVTARLGNRMRALGLPDFRAYLHHLESDKTGHELTTLLDAISTNVTYFFREPEHFEFIKRTFATWVKNKQRRIRMWSAACSSGDEPYSLVMALADQLNSSIDFRVLATDISTKILQAAMQGVYAGATMDNVPAALKSRYMTQLPGGQYEVKAEIKEKILFRHLNLMEIPYPLTGPLDMILCRNVMIYFDPSTRQRLINEFHRLLKPGGHLIISHSESLVGMVTPFKMIQPSVYMKAAQEAAA